jgi:hypothetical protein
MIEEHYRILIHQEIDGEIPEKDRIKLLKYLDGNPEAKSLYQNLEKTSDLLGTVPEIEPSPHLKKHIMNSIDFRTTASEKPFSSSLASRFKTFLSRPYPRLAYALVLGIIIGFLFTSIFLGNFIRQNKIDISDLYGTIGLKNLDAFNTVMTTPVDVSGIQGSVEVKEYRNVVAVKVSLKAHSVFDTHLSFNPELIQFVSFKPLSPSMITLKAERNSIGVLQSHEIKYLFFFSKRTQNVPAVELMLVQRGEIVLRENILHMISRKK